MAESEVKSGAHWLGKLLVEQISHLDGVRDLVEDLNTELNGLAAFLIEAVKTHRQNQVVQNVISDARDVAYDCQDVIETYILQVARHGYDEYEGFQLRSVVRLASLVGNAIPILKIHSKIVKLNKRISALHRRMKAYRNPKGTSTSSASLPDDPLRPFYSHDREECVVVGFETQLVELVERLVDPTDKPVIAICGMGGVGKSTLAREIYHHLNSKDGGYFRSFGWASASRQLKLDEVLRTLLHCFVPENDHESRRQIDEDIKAHKGHEALYNRMTNNKCLVVIDDIWTSNDLTKLRAAFPIKNASGSKILLTTRNEETVSGLDPTEVYLHPVKALDETNSWELFEKTAFPGESSCTNSKMELGREMLQHCKGVPLAIVVLAKVLKRKPSVNSWTQMRNDISSQIQKGGAPNLYKEVYDVLQVSYDELPSHLKLCFLHLANFPEDYEILTDKLYQLWIAEGMVSKKDATDPRLEEDIAKEYLNELVNRSMVQMPSSVHQMRIETCHMHDLMRDVCMDISRRQDFLQIINCKTSMLLSNTNRNSSAKNLLVISLPKRDKRLRRLAVYVTDDQEAQGPGTDPTSTSAKVSRAPNLRSLLFFVGKELEEEEKSKKLVKVISTDFPLLRILDCVLLLRGKLPKEIGNMIHLRYLGLKDTYVTELPSSIQKIQWLQTLDLRLDSSAVITIPNVLWMLKQLRHLYLPSDGELLLVRQQVKNANGVVCDYKVKPRYLIKGGEMLRLDGLENLQTVLNLDLDRLDLLGLSEVVAMGRVERFSAPCETNKTALGLFITCSSMKSVALRLHAQIINEEPMILSSYECLHRLEVHSKPYSGYSLEKPLSLEMLPESLVELLIFYVDVTDDPMPVLEKLPNLGVLKLRMCYRREKMVCTVTHFPELTYLVLDGLFYLKHWEAPEGALPKLKEILIINCPLERMPEAITPSVHQW